MTTASVAHPTADIAQRAATIDAEVGNREIFTSVLTPTTQSNQTEMPAVTFAHDPSRALVPVRRSRFYFDIAAKAIYAALQNFQIKVQITGHRLPFRSMEPALRDDVGAALTVNSCRTLAYSAQTH